DRITWRSTPQYTYEARPGQYFAHWYRIDSSFELRTLEPITNESQVLISFRGTSGEFISAGLAAPPFGRDGYYRYGTSFPADSFPPPGTYTVNSVCRYWSDGRERCRAAYPAEAVNLVIPERG
ncbi:MAG TPA: hypothetical protein VNB24_05660, partial [Acidimicrobiales bacterium]|nr:hypothetical protein [Acidimicrobiales bacterium]